MSSRLSDDFHAGSQPVSSLIAANASRLRVSSPASTPTPAPAGSDPNSNAHLMALEIQNRELRASLRKAEQQRSRYFELFESSPVAYFVFDERHHLHDLNLAAGLLLPGERSKLKHRPFFPHLTDSDRTRFHRHLTEVFRERTSNSITLKLINGGSTPQVYRFLSQPAPSTPGEPTMVVSAVLRESETAAAPVAPTVNCASGAAAMAWDPEEVDVENGLMLCAQKALAPKLTPELAALWMERVSQDPADLIQSWVEECRAQPGLAEIVLEMMSPLPITTFYPWHLARLVRNLLLNAAESQSQNPGSIRVRANHRWLEAGVGVTQAFNGKELPTGNYLVLEVADNGTGMNGNHANQALDPFYSTKSDGRGLGLAAVKAAVALHGGGIAVASYPGSGTSVQVFLPSAAPAKRDVGAHPVTHAAPSESQNAGRILLVDDEAGVRMIIARMLESLGYAVEEASNGAEALSRFAQGPNRYRWVVSDMNMPGMDGVFLAHELKRQNPGIGCVIMSGLCEIASDTTAGSDPGMVFLQKPFTLPGLEEALMKAAPPSLTPFLPSEAMTSGSLSRPVH